MTDARHSRRAVDLELMRRRFARLRTLSKLVFTRVDDASVRTYSASIAYHAILALVSFSAVLLFLVQVRIGDDSIGTSGSSRLPSDLQQAARAQAERIEDLSSSGIVLLTLAGLLLGLFGLASGFAALFDALNRIHGTHRYTTMMIRYGRAFIVALCFTTSFSLALAIVARTTAAGTALFEGLGLPLLGSIANAIVLLVTVLIIVPLTFTALLRYGSRARPSWRECAAAGTVSGWGMLLFTVGFLTFVGVAEPYRMYGAMGTALVILVLAYWSSYLMLTSVIFAEVFEAYANIGLSKGWEAWKHRDPNLTWRERIRHARERRRMRQR